MKIKAVIVDDERHSRETLKNLLQEFCPDVAVLALAGSVQDGIAAITQHNPDVVFLDIELQVGTGFDIITQIENVNFEIIFTTAFEQYAIKAVKFSSLDYLLKPIDVEELQQAVGKVQKKKDQDVYKRQIEILIDSIKEQPKLNKICLSTSDSFEFVTIENIIYCQANGSYTNFVLKDGKAFLVSKHLKEYESLLAEHLFMRVHNSTLINLKEVEKFVKSDGGYILMSNGDSVSVSRGKKDDFLRAMNLLLQ